MNFKRWVGGQVSGFAFLFLCILIFPLKGYGQWIDADSLKSFSYVRQDFNHDGKPDNIGEKVAVSGIANVATGTFHEVYFQIYLQNEDAGLPVFRQSFNTPVAAGDSVVVKGKIQIYFGEPEIQVDEYRVYPKKDVKLKPVNMFIALRDSSKYCGMLVNGTGIIREKGYRFNGKYLTISPNDSSSQHVNVFVSNFNAKYRAFDFNKTRIGDKVTVTGILAQLNPKYPDNKTYKVYLRTPNDFSYASFPHYYINYIIIGLLILLLAIGGWMIALRIQVKRKTKALETSLNEKEVLLKEIHHRVKNNLAIISGLLELQKGASGNEEVQTALEESQARISSMAIVHDKLYRSSSLSAIPMDSYLEGLVETIHNTFAQNYSGIDTEIDADPIELNVDKVVPLGLLVDELLINAQKHAFKNVENPKITINLRQDTDAIVLKVEDNGVGLPDDLTIAECDSLGMMLINTFAQQLNAEKTVENTPGACFTFCFPRSE